MANKKKVKRKSKKTVFRIPEWVFFLLIIFVAFLMYDMLFGISFSTTSYTTTSNISLEIPKFMDVVKHDDATLELKTVRSMAAVSKDMKKIRKNYEVISCEKEEYYYQENSNISISYQIKRGLLFNYLTIHYEKGKPTCLENQKEEEVSNCRFTRTYMIDFIKPMDDLDKIYVTLSSYQGETETILLPSIWKENLVVNHSYEFTFSQIGTKVSHDEKIPSIFSSYVVVDVKETQLQGLEQKQDAICK